MVGEPEDAVPELVSLLYKSGGGSFGIVATGGEERMRVYVVSDLHLIFPFNILL